MQMKGALLKNDQVFQDGDNRELSQVEALLSVGPCVTT